MSRASRTLPIFLGDNTGTTSKRDPASNGAIGEHGTFTHAANGIGVPPVQTYIYASYDTPHIYPAAFDGVQDITVLSHEVEEWMNDPFIQNATPAWDAPVYGYGNLLEVGDPALAETFPVAMPNRITYHPQVEGFLPWFARSAPSSFNGAYDYMRAFTSYAPSCKGSVALEDVTLVRAGARHTGNGRRGQPAERTHRRILQCSIRGQN